MDIDKKYEDVVAERDAALAREAEVGRIYDSLVKRSNRERDASYKREAALREERDNRPDVSIKNCIFKGENANGSQAFEFKTLEGGLNKLTKINLDGWLCYGPSGESPVTVLQQRLTVAEQRVDLLEGLLKSGSSPTHAHCSAVMEALKPAEGEGS